MHTTPYYQKLQFIKKPSFLPTGTPANTFNSAFTIPLLQQSAELFQCQLSKPFDTKSRTHAKSLSPIQSWQQDIYPNQTFWQEKRLKQKQVQKQKWISRHATQRRAKRYKKLWLPY
jgi:hypothetical protein